MPAKKNTIPTLTMKFIMTLLRMWLKMILNVAYIYIYMLFILKAVGVEGKILF